VFFKPDGLKMYVVGSTSDQVREYNLSTAWNVTTASYLQGFSVSTQDGSPGGLFFKPDGTKMYIVGTINDQVREYNLSTAWNVTTASYLQGFSVLNFSAISAREEAPQAVFFKDDGTEMFIVGTTANTVLKFNLTTAWNITTSTVPNYFYVGNQDLVPGALFFKPDGLKMYVVGAGQDQVREYNLSTAWDISTASYLQGFSVAVEESTPTGLFFRSDGLKMYVVGITNDQVREYNLSTAWNVTTASYLQGFSVAGQDTNPQGLFFKPDGLKMYVVGSTNDQVREYNLSTAWNVTTASYLQGFSVGGQDTFPSGVSFKDDGTKMYIVGLTSDQVREYNLSTAWNVTTATYVQGLSVSNLDTDSQDLFFKPDGTKLYIIGSSSDSIYCYSL
jgi:hypothetical protein